MNVTSGLKHKERLYGRLPSQMDKAGAHASGHDVWLGRDPARMGLLEQFKQSDLMKKNLITITRHPSISCYVEEGTRSGKLYQMFISELLAGGSSARTLYGVGRSEFYLNYRNKPSREQELWVIRLGLLHLFTGLHME